MANSVTLEPAREWRQTIAVGAIALAACVGTGVQVGGRAEQSLNRARAEHEAVQASLTTVKAWASASPRADAATLEAELTNIANSARADADPGALFERVQRIAKATSVRVAEVTPIEFGPAGGLSAQDRIESQCARMTVSGTFASVTAFLEEAAMQNGLGAFPRISSWSALPLGDEGNPEVRLTVDVELLRFDVSARTEEDEMQANPARARGAGQEQ